MTAAHDAILTAGRAIAAQSEGAADERERVIRLLRRAPFGLRVAMQNAEALAPPHFRTFAACEAAADWLATHPDGDPRDPEDGRS